MRRVGSLLKRTAVSFYDDQMTHHAAALTYYGLMSLFPALLLGVSLLGLLGQYPETYNSVVSYLRDVVPPDTLNAIDHSLKRAIQHKGNATAALVIAVITALYGTTGALEAARRALNVAFGVEKGRNFIHRKARDVVSSFILIGLVLITLIFVFVGGTLADHVFGENGAHAWNIVRWPLAVLMAMLAFAYIYYVTPDLEEREFRLMTPGAAVAVVAWILISFGFSQYLSHYSDVNAIYGTFAGAIVLVAWVWLTNVSLLFGAELNSALSRERETTASDLDVAPAPR
ncbi:MAG TPA: YihY/virulence factor BrkB family protein [Thermoleophilaceae bacterium]|nr:YihY/virulence factor BrkB family protein [Thermoleophilaceae bacterium]